MEILALLFAFVHTICCTKAKVKWIYEFGKCEHFNDANRKHLSVNYFSLNYGLRHFVRWFHGSKNVGPNMKRDENVGPTRTTLLFKS